MIEFGRKVLKTLNKTKGIREMIIKDKGESWTDNVIDPDEVIFVHDKAPCMRANKTQRLLQDNDVKFWG
ncbi:unnamed protein product, partial [Rotaria magnacalcarata]